MNLKISHTISQLTLRSAIVKCIWIASIPLKKSFNAQVSDRNFAISTLAPLNVKPAWLKHCNTSQNNNNEIENCREKIAFMTFEAIRSFSSSVGTRAMAMPPPSAALISLPTANFSDIRDDNFCMLPI